MTFHITHRYGNMESNPSPDLLGALLSELDERPDDEEHGDVSLTHESEWCLSANRSGDVWYENLEEGEPRYMEGLARDRIIGLWLALSEGMLEVLEQEPWLPGYP